MTSRRMRLGEKVKLKLQILDQALFQQLANERLTATITDAGNAKQVAGKARSRERRRTTVLSDGHSSRAPGVGPHQADARPFSFHTADAAKPSLSSKHTPVSKSK